MSGRTCNCTKAAKERRAGWSGMVSSRLHARLRCVRAASLATAGGQKCRRLKDRSKRRNDGRCDRLAVTASNDCVSLAKLLLSVHVCACVCTFV